LDQQTVDKITKQEQESLQKGQGSSFKGRASSALLGRTRSSRDSQTGGRTGSRASQSEKEELRAEAAVLPPPYTREMNLIKAKDEGIVGQLLVNSLVK
jgi:hypothetical protein